MGRLLEPVGNCRPRLMIVAAQAEQNPAYRFAAEKIPPSAKQEGVIFCIYESV